MKELNQGNKGSKKPFSRSNPVGPVMWGEGLGHPQEEQGGRMECWVTQHHDFGSLYGYTCMSWECEAIFA